MTSAPSIDPRSTPSMTRNAKPRMHPSRPIKGRWRPRASAPSPRRSRLQANSISPRITISSIWRRIRPAIAGLAAPGCRVQSARASAPDRHQASISRFRVRADARPGMTTLRLLQMPGEEAEAARPGDIGTGLVVTRPLVAMKTVLRPRIDVDLDLGPSCADGLDIGERNARILFSEVQLRRYARFVVGETNDGAAVIADRSRQPRQFCRGGISDAAAEAETVDAGRGIAQHRRPVRIGDELARHRDLIGRIAGGEIGLDAVEDSRRDGDIALACETVA